jgi:hypothetical protein
MPERIGEVVLPLPTPPQRGPPSGVLGFTVRVLALLP